jgi:hypothetical protein
MTTLRLLSVCFIAVLYASVATAHDAGPIYTTFSDVGYDFRQTEDHDDDEPWKGWVTVNVTNTSTVAWGGFHFFLFSIGQDISNVKFIDGVIDSINYDPQSSQGTLEWDIDNSMPNPKIDLYYFGDPLLPDESAWFKVFTDNTTDKVMFGVAFYPSEIPEPATMGLLGLGLAAMIVRKRRTAA